MCQTSINVWFVCKLCRGSFGQVDAFIEHKKQKHFTQFQNTTSIVFEESEQGLLYPAATNEDHQFADESNEPRIKIEVNTEDPIIPFSSGVIDVPDLDLFEPKSELITFECEINAVDENSFFGLKQPQQNPYVLLKRLTTEEIQSACVPQHHWSLLKCEQTIFTNSFEPPHSSDTGRNTYDHNKVEIPTEIQPTPTIGLYLLFECKLCSKQLESDAQLKIHVGICALYHEDRNRFCVICNRKFFDTKRLKYHCLRFHGTEEEKSSLFKFKCHLCPRQYQQARDLRSHMDTHEKKQQVTVSKSKRFKCSHPNCGKEFRGKSNLQAHLATHLDLRPFSCSFPNCNKTFTRKDHVTNHFRIHTGERLYKCKVDNCNKTYVFPTDRSRHHRIAHRN